MKWGDDVVHSFNCTPHFPDMGLADALVNIKKKFFLNVYYRCLRQQT